MQTHLSREKYKYLQNQGDKKYVGTNENHIRSNQRNPRNWPAERINADGTPTNGEDRRNTECPSGVQIPRQLGYTVRVSQQSTGHNREIPDSHRRNPTSQRENIQLNQRKEYNLQKKKIP